MTRIIIGIAAVMMMTSLAQADSLDRFARGLNRQPGIHHSFANRAGDKVVFKSSGRASQAAAIQSWQNSPAHSAILPSVTRIVCRGSVCVGR